ncbi:hypothetical protein ACN95_04650 [Gordonia sihwensis]|nr:cytochrome c oxidase assembly protein [Gordonia sp. YC-JH1]MBY4569315.1 hypothetical protein [Gordonia sihwensis]
MPLLHMLPRSDPLPDDVAGGGPPRRVSWYAPHDYFPSPDRTWRIHGATPQCPHGTLGFPYFDIRAREALKYSLAQALDGSVGTCDDRRVPVSELTVSSALTTWNVDALSTLPACVCAVAYLLLARGTRVGIGTRIAFVTGCAIWWLATNSFTAVYGEVLFWVRSLTFVLLTVVTGFLLAAGRPVTVIASHRRAGRTLMRIGRTRIVRVLLSPLATSALMLVTPWLLFLTRGTPPPSTFPRWTARRRLFWSWPARSTSMRDSRWTRCRGIGTQDCRC